MRAKACLTTLAIGTLVTVSARADFYDNFNSYADTAALNAVWTPSTGTGLILQSGTNYSSPGAIMNPGTTGQSSRVQITAQPASNLSFSFNFYDIQTGSSRDYGMVYSRSGSLWSDGLNNLLAIGKYNSPATTKYFGRVSTATGAIYGDGATTNGASGGWFTLNNAPDRTVGWHSALITGEPDLVDAGKVVYKFYIDGILGGSVSGVTDYNYNWIVLGSGLSTSPAGIIYDDVQVTAVPEPSTLALALLGGLGLVAQRAARRRNS